MTTLFYSFCTLLISFFWVTLFWFLFFWVTLFWFLIVYFPFITGKYMNLKFFASVPLCSIHHSTRFFAHSFPFTHQLYLSASNYYQRYFLAKLVRVLISSFASFHCSQPLTMTCVSNEARVTQYPVKLKSLTITSASLILILCLSTLQFSLSTHITTHVCWVHRTPCSIVHIWVNTQPSSQKLLQHM